MRAGVTISIVVAALAMATCGERTPKRDYMAVIKSRFDRLQTALRDRNGVVLDSLSSRTMIRDGMTIDSLLSFAEGPDRAGRFARFGRYEIIYNNKKARIDCSLVDSAGRAYQSVTLTFVRESDDWKLKRFEPALPPIDTLH
ncbi:MAG: hypothetical protein HY851_05020 [candidate division Zixibacteria bacterium]|nr:hypothetical protein [candidate division Zixibacteria bacterium]